MEKIITESEEIKRLYLDMKSEGDEVSKKLAEITEMYDEVKAEKLSFEDQLFKKEQELQQLNGRVLLFQKGTQLELLNIF